MIPIEERDESEVLGLTYHGDMVAPAGAHARNPAFDVTPNRLVSAIVTEVGIVYPPYAIHLAEAVTTSQGG
jgi:methylthioribose-1-phosphate isomerase